MRTRSVVRLVVLASWLTLAPSALAQLSGASQGLETSIRSAGMGGATTAVSWGEPGVWGNPAALANTRGIAWLEGSTRLVPELDGDTRFKTRRFLVGGAGVGVSLMGVPVEGLGRARLEITGSLGTDPFGNPTGSYEAHEQVEAWAVGVSPLQLVDAVRGRGDTGAKPAARDFDVSLGYQHKRTEVVLAPGVRAEADNFDWGVQGHYMVLHGDVDGRAASMDLAAGYAVLNADQDSRFDFAGAGAPVPSARMERIGFAVVAVLPFASGGDPWSWWLGTVPRAVQLGLAYDREHLTAEGTSLSQDADHVGLEGSLLEILALRLGYVNDPDGNIADLSYGVGVHAPIGPWGSVGYDWASDPVPKDSGLASTKRHGFSAWIHPTAILESWRGGR